MSPISVATEGDSIIEPRVNYQRTIIRKSTHAQSKIVVDVH